MDTTLTSYTWAQFTPAFVLVGLAIAIFMADAFLPKLPKRAFALIGAAGAFIIACVLSSENALAGMVCVATTLSLLLAYDYGKVTCESVAGGSNEEGTSEFYALPLVACAGIICLTQAQDIITLFVSLEVITLSSYVLAGYFRRNQGSIEAGVKYLILGALSTGMLVFGAAWYFGTTGTFSLSVCDSGVAAAIASGSYLRVGFLMGVALLFAGALFKIGAAPMHMWIPDVYQGAPTPVSSFLATASKIAGLSVLFVLMLPFLPFMVRCPEAVAIVAQLLALVAAATLLIGNLGAIGQSNLKRLLGYSSIGQAGFIIVLYLGMHHLGSFGMQLFTYVSAYVLATSAAFFAVAMVRTQRGSEEISAFRGLAKTNPRTAFLITVSFASLAGVPLTQGFLAKMYSFVTLINVSGIWAGIFWLLLPIMVVCAAAGFYYYFKVLRAMYWEKPLEGDKPLQVPGVTATVLTVIAVMLIVLGVYPLIFAA